MRLLTRYAIEGVAKILTAFQVYHVQCMATVLYIFGDR